MDKGQKLFKAKDIELAMSEGGHELRVAIAPQKEMQDLNKVWDLNKYSGYLFKDENEQQRLFYRIDSQNSQGNFTIAIQKFDKKEKISEEKSEQIIKEIRSANRFRKPYKKINITNISFAGLPKRHLFEKQDLRLIAEFLEDKKVELPSDFIARAQQATIEVVSFRDTKIYEYKPGRVK